MKIAIKPVELFVPGKGLVKATHLEVAIGQYELGVRASGNYEVQAEIPVPAGAPENAKPTYKALANGRADLSPEQFAAWGTDDAAFVAAIALNAGLVPA